VEKAALLATNPGRFELPRPMVGRPGCDFSFSGLKTAVRRHVEELGTPLSAEDQADLAAAFQATVAEVMADRCARAIRQFKEAHPQGGALVVAGGVAANKTLRARLQTLADKERMPFVAPPLRLCTDNAAMIAWAGIERLRLGQTDPLNFAPRPRWPLDPTAKPVIGKAGVGSGVKA